MGRKCVSRSYTILGYLNCSLGWKAYIVVPLTEFIAIFLFSLLLFRNILVSLLLGFTAFTVTLVGLYLSRNDYEKGDNP